MTQEPGSSGSGRRLTQTKLKLLAIGISTFTCLALLIAVGEIAVRRREATRNTVPGTMPTIYYRHKWLGHALVHNTSYYDWVHINSYGFRGPEIDITADPGVTRIMVVGASTTFDIGVSSDSNTWPARLEFYLNERRDSSTRFEVVNAGVGGYTVLDQIVRFQSDLYPLHPDLVILYIGHNDLFGALRRGFASSTSDSDRPSEVDPQSRIRTWLESNSLLYSKVTMKVGAIQFGRVRKSEDGPPTDIEQILANEKPLFAQRSRSLIRMMTEENIPVIVPRVVHVGGTATTPGNGAEAAMWGRTVPFAGPDDVLRGYREFGDTLLAVAAAAGAVPVESDGFQVTGPDFYAVGDPIHFNDRGADFFARAMADVVDRWFADSRSASSRLEENSHSY